MSTRTQLYLFEMPSIQASPKKSSDPAGGRSQDDEYNTPKWLWQLGLDVFGLDEYDIDLATNETSTVPAYRKFMLRENSLSKPWRIPERKITRGWLNPPFSRNRDFAQKLCSEYRKGGLEMIVLNKHDHRVGWWWELEAAATGLCLIRGYVKFEGQRQGYRFPVSVFYFGSDYDAFAFNFRGVGRCIAL